MIPTASVLLPSRTRVSLLRESITSLLETAERPEAIEILIAADPDDHDTQEFARAEKHTILVTAERYGYSRLNEYVNRLAELATAPWLLLWNDDAVMTTPGWDAVVNAAQHPRMLFTKSNFPDPSLCLFPIVSRSVVNALGHFSLSPHNDTWITDVCAQVGIIQQSDIFIQHNRFSETGLNDDEVYRESQVGYRSNDYYSDEMTTLRVQDAARLKELLNL